MSFLIGTFVRSSSSSPHPFTNLELKSGFHSNFVPLLLPSSLESFERQKGKQYSDSQLQEGRRHLSCSLHQRNCSEQMHHYNEKLVLSLLHASKTHQFVQLLQCDSALHFTRFQRLPFLAGCAVRSQPQN